MPGIRFWNVSKRDGIWSSFAFQKLFFMSWAPKTFPAICVGGPLTSRQGHILGVSHGSVFLLTQLLKLKKNPSKGSFFFSNKHQVGPVG